MYAVYWIGVHNLSNEYEWAMNDSDREDEQKQKIKKIDSKI